MGFSKDREMKSRTSIWRVAKTLFFLVTMSISFLLFSAPALLILADTLLPPALLSASLRTSPFSFKTLYTHFRNYDFRYSLVDIPLISVLRSVIISCVYGLCDGPTLSSGPYLGVTMVCSVLSLFLISLKASFVFSDSMIDRGGYDRAMKVALFVCSWALAIGHVFAAYRTSCRERRKLLVYKIDVEAVSGFSRYQKMLQEERVK